MGELLLMYYYFYWIIKCSLLTNYYNMTKGFCYFHMERSFLTLLFTVEIKARENKLSTVRPSVWNNKWIAIGLFMLLTRIEDNTRVTWKWAFCQLIWNSMDSSDLEKNAPKFLNFNTEKITKRIDFFASLVNLKRFRRVTI